MCLYSSSVRRNEKEIGCFWHIYLSDWIWFCTCTCCFLFLLENTRQKKCLVLGARTENGRTKSQETGLSFPWKFIPLPQPITKKTSVSWGGKFCLMETSIVWEKGHTPKDFKKPLWGDERGILNTIQVLWKARAGSWDRADMPMVTPKRVFQRQLGIQASSSHPRTLIIVRRCHHSTNEVGRHHWRMSSEVSLLREVTCSGPCISGHQLEFPGVWVLHV